MADYFGDIAEELKYTEADLASYRLDSEAFQPVIEVSVDTVKDKRKDIHTFSLVASDVMYLFNPSYLAEELTKAIMDCKFKSNCNVKISGTISNSAPLGQLDAEVNRYWMSLTQLSGNASKVYNREVLYDALLGKLDAADKYDEQLGTLDFNYGIIAIGDNPSDMHYTSRLQSTIVSVTCFKHVSGGATPLHKFDFKVDPGLCGPAVLFYYHYKSDIRMANVIANFKKGNSCKTNSEKVSTFMKELGLETNMAMKDFGRYTDKYPDKRIRIVMPQKGSKGIKVLYDHMGVDYVITSASNSANKDCFISHENDHYTYINNLSVYAGYHGTYTLCNVCLTSMTKAAYARHSCIKHSCPCCQKIFNDEEASKEHFSALERSKCDKCNFTMMYKECMVYHSCSKWKCPSCNDIMQWHMRDKHKCHHKECTSCKMMVPIKQIDKTTPYPLKYALDPDHLGMVTHRCVMQPVGLKSARTSMDMYVFDFESTRGPKGEQHVSMVVVDKLYAQPGHKRICETLAEFDDFLCSIKDKAIFIAHNGAKYDFVLLYKYLVSTHTKRCDLPKEKIMAGKDIITFKYHNVTFHDSIRHLGASLADLPKKFGLPIAKSHFPYDFYTDENVNYVGPIPDKKYFNCDEWHADFVKSGKVYDIKAECMKYCEMDVQVLKLVVENYIRSAIGNPMLYPTIGSYAKAIYRSQFMETDAIDMLRDFEYTFLKESGAYQGGRTETFILKNDTKMQYLDFNSLYPSVMRYDRLPAKVKGLYNIDLSGEEANAWLKELHSKGYIGVMTYEAVSEGLHIPVLGVQYEKKLVFPNGSLSGGSTSIELEMAANMGYHIKIKDCLIFTQRSDLFKDFIDHFYAQKQACDEAAANGTNGTTNTAGERTVCKLLLNNLWGKFGEKSDKPSSHIVDNRGWDMYVSKYERGVCTIDIGEEGDDWVEVIETLNNPQPTPNSNLAIAIFVTANARLKLYGAMDYYGEKLCYCDTDSIVVIDDDSPGLPTSTNLGELKDELNGDHFIKWLSSGPKMYCGITTQGDSKIASKGFKPPADYYDVLDRMVVQNGIETIENCIRFKRHNIGINVESHAKKIRSIMTKREVSGDYTTKALIIKN